MVQNYIQGFKDLLTQKPKEIQTVINENWKDDNGEPVVWTFLELTAKELNKIADEIDPKEDYYLKIAVNSVVSPDFKSRAFLEAIGVGSPYMAIEQACSSASSTLKLRKTIDELHGLKSPWDIPAGTIKN